MANTMKRMAVALVAGILVCTFSGCATVQRKFTRKPKQPKYVAKVIAFEEGPHQKKFSNEYYYKTRYTYWKAWHGEWIDGLNGNRKRTARNAQETLSNLEQMAGYLKPEKAKGLDEPIAILTRLRTQMETGQFSGSGPVRTDLETWRRIISSNFYFEKIKDELLEDSVDLGESPAVAPTPVPSA